MNNTCRRSASPGQLRLETLASKSLIRVFVDRCGARKGWWPPGLAWKRIYGRYDPGARCYCTLLFETRDTAQYLCSVEAYQEKPQAAEDFQQVLPHSQLGWLRLCRFPSDRRLKALPGLIARADAVEVLRYRPQRRCTLAVCHSSRDGPSIAKVFADNRGEHIHKGNELLWCASGCGELGFNVAEPLEWDASTHTLWQKEIRGRSIASSLFGESGRQVAQKMGAACASLAVSSLYPPSVFGRREQLQRSLRYANELAIRLPELRGEIRAMLRSLDDAGRTLRNRAAVPIHGAPHLHQWLECDDGLGLVDFDRFSMGEAELDAATFISEMDFEDRAIVDAEGICDQFLLGYEEIFGALDRKLLQYYRAQKRLAKALKAARAVRLDYADKARRHLCSAVECLREFP